MRYCYGIFLILSLLLAGCGGHPNAESEVDVHTSKLVQIGTRSYILAFPANYPHDKPSDHPYKLLLAFHGSGGSATEMQKLSAFEKASNDYIVAYLQSEQVEWNEGCDCNIAHRLETDDLGFVEQVIQQVSRKYPIGSGEVYAVGFSQGGLFAENVACNLSLKVKAVAVVAAPMSVQLAQKCQPTQPVSIMMVIGKNDGVLPYNGEVHPNFGLISAPSAIQLFARINQSLAEPVRKTLFNGLVELQAYTNGKQKAELYSITDGGHQWQFAGNGSTFNTTQEIIRFFNELNVPTLPASSKLVAVDGANYHVRVLGEANSGPAVVLLAGPNQNFHSDSAWFSLVQPLLAKQYRVYAIDRLGNAWSDLNTDLSYRRFAKDLGPLLTQLQEKEVVVVAFASGSIAARLFQQQYQNSIKVKGMLLIDPDVPMPQSLALYQAYPVDWYQAQLDSLLPHLATGAWNVRTHDKLKAEREVVTALIAPQYQDLMDWQYFDLVSQQRLLISHQQSRAREIASYAADLEAYQALAPLSSVPVSVIDSDFEAAEVAADLSNADTIKAWQKESNEWNRTQASIAGGEYVPLVKSHHLVMLQQPEVVVQAVQHLLAK